MNMNAGSRISLAALFTWAGWMTAELKGAGDHTGINEVIIVFKTHFDIGYTDMASNVVRRYQTTMIDQALRVADQNRDLPPEQQFAWTIPGWPMSKILDDWPGQTPNRKQRVMEAFASGRFVVHALPFTTHTELLEPEDLVRGLGYASRLSRSAGLPLPRDAKMTDVPCHSWVMPTLLKNAGVDFLHLGCNAASSSPRVPRLFWWEGPDGSRLLTMYSAESYGTGLAPPADWPYRAWLALIHTGDNHGPPTPGEVRQLLDEAKQKLPGVKVRIGRLSDFADAILTETIQIPVVRGDMPDTWIHGPMCDPLGAKTARNLRPAIGAAEMLDTELRLWGKKAPDSGVVISHAFENSLLYGEHTWGGALYWVTSYSGDKNYHYGMAWKELRDKGTFQRLENSWAEHSSYIQRAEELVRTLISNETLALAKAVKIVGPRVVVFNPLAWERDDIVRLDAKGFAGNGVKPSDGQEIVAVERDGDRIRFLARRIPPMGYRTFVPATFINQARQHRHAEAENVIESPFFRATLDPSHCAIRSLIDKRTGREMVDASAPHGFGQYVYERFDRDQVAAYVRAYVKIQAAWATNELGKPSLPPASEASYHAMTPENGRLRVEQTPAATCATMESAGGLSLNHKVTTQLTLYQDQAYADLEIMVHDKPADPWPEACWISLPFKVDPPHIRLARLGSIIDPNKDIVPGANQHLLAMNGGLTISDAHGWGAGLCALDHPLVSFDEPGCWRYARDHPPRSARVYVNFFNNQWTTNFRLWNGGTWSSRVRIWAVRKADAAQNLITPSWESRQPCLAAYTDGEAGTLVPTSIGLQLSRAGALITAFGPNPDGEGIVLRLWEMSGSDKPCRIQWGPDWAFKEIHPVDLRGQAVARPLQKFKNGLKTPLRPFAPVSFILK